LVDLSSNSLVDFSGLDGFDDSNDLAWLRLVECVGLIRVSSLV